VWLREFGDTPDRVDLARCFADEPIAENYLSASPDGRWVMDRVQKGDGGEWQVFLRSQGADGSWWRVADIPDKCVHAVVGTDALYLLSFRDAPHGNVLRLPLTSGTTVAGADEIVSAGDPVIEDLAVTRDTVWVVDMDSGPSGSTPPSTPAAWPSPPTPSCAAATPTRRSCHCTPPNPPPSTTLIAHS